MPDIDPIELDRAIAVSVFGLARARQGTPPIPKVKFSAGEMSWTHLGFDARPVLFTGDLRSGVYRPSSILAHAWLAVTRLRVDRHWAMRLEMTSAPLPQIVRVLLLDGDNAPDAWDDLVLADCSDKSPCKAICFAILKALRTSELNP